MRALFVSYVMITAVFFLVRMLPGNPVDVFINKMTAEGVPYEDAAASASAMYSFDLETPMWQQYLDYLLGVLRGDFGMSISAPGTEVMALIARDLPWTLFTVGTALIISVTIGLTLGMYMAYRRGGVGDHVISTLGSALHAIPNYLMAIMLVVIGGVHLGWFDFARMRGTYSSGIQPELSARFISDAFYHGTLPIITYVLTTVGTWALVMKASTTQALGEDFVMVARARGLPSSRIGTMYVGRNAVLPLVAQIATQAGFVVGGAIFVEFIFSYNGIGSLLFNSVHARDYPVIQGILLIITVTVVFANLIADLTYGLLDPRIRTSGLEEQ
jgi:peptide/nickel transport system permease protein